MIDPAVRWLNLPAGCFRALEWPGSEPFIVLLHGLTGVAEVWAPTVARLPDTPGRCIAIDQRGHGQSAKPPTGYAVGAFVSDLMAALVAAGIERPHLVGHSMGARVAMVAAARHPEQFRSVSIIDIGPEAWRANWVDSLASFDRMPRQFASLDEALGRLGRARGGESLDATLAASNDELRTIAAARFQLDDDSHCRWRADIEALKQAVKAQRSRSYWREWRALNLPALFIRGGTSAEVRPAIAERMRRMNPRVLVSRTGRCGAQYPPARAGEAGRGARWILAISLRADDVVEGWYASNAIAGAGGRGLTRTGWRRRRWGGRE